jgi:hypothetical protein
MLSFKSFTGISAAPPIGPRPGLLSSSQRQHDAGKQIKLLLHRVDLLLLTHHRGEQRLQHIDDRGQDTCL